MEVKCTGRRIMLPKETQNGPPRSLQEGNAVIYVVMIRAVPLFCIVNYCIFWFWLFDFLGETGGRREV